MVIKMLYCKNCNKEIVKCNYCGKDFILGESIRDITVETIGLKQHLHFHSDFCFDSYLLGYKCEVD